jgi:regulatory protein
MKITSIKQQVKAKDRYSIFVEGKYALGLSSSELLSKGIVVGQDLDSGQLATLKKAAVVDGVYGLALRYVTMRPRSSWEMETYLKRKQASPEIVASIMKRLQGLGLIDDLSFGQAWVSNRRLLKSVSKRRLVLELKQKHVSDDIISQVLDSDEANDLSVLRELVAKKSKLYTDSNKLIGYLARQGFSYDDIKSVLGEELSN